jgi:hypothetical protein
MERSQIKGVKPEMIERKLRSVNWQGRQIKRRKTNAGCTQRFGSSILVALAL